FANQVSQIINIVNTIQSSLTGAQRVFEVLDAPLEITSPPNAVRLSKARGAIHFDRVDFAYRPNQPVLYEISLQVEPGQCVGIMGPSGAGKSTLLSLVSSFYGVTGGGISSDGVDVRQLDLDDLRRNIGSVYQDSFLFSNTVAANI